MIANITIANKTKTPIWSKGAIALIIDFKTTCKPIVDVGGRIKRKMLVPCSISRLKINKSSLHWLQQKTKSTIIDYTSRRLVYSLGIPDTNFKGRNTLIALNVLRSKPPRSTKSSGSTVKNLFGWLWNSQNNLFKKCFQHWLKSLSNISIKLCNYYDKIKLK